MKVYNNMMELIGKTPMVRFLRYQEGEEVLANIIAKLEMFNPGGSVKDRTAHAMIKKAELDGLLNEDSVIIEPTSGNTGIGLALVAASKGYKLILVMPNTMSTERRDLLSALGARVVLSDGKQGVKGAVALAEELQQQTSKSIILHQFENEANSISHRMNTAREIWDDLDGEIDILVAGIGTGGTITGIGEFLKDKKPAVEVIGVEPDCSPFLSREIVGSHKIQGIGVGFMPAILKREIIDEILTVSCEDAKAVCQKIAATEGVLMGISSGAAMFAAVEIGKRPENVGKNIVVICPDTGERYLSTDLFNKFKQ
jgi:cysteine synthase A